MKIMSVGAESKVFLNGNEIIKDRIKKGYRIAELDKKLRISRTKLEFKILNKCYSLGIRVPRPIKLSKSLTKIFMEYLGNKTLKDNFNIKYLNDAAMMIAKMHNRGIIHGDLTTANMIIKGDKIYLIDFGLGYFSQKTEDKATDLFLLKNALKAKHTKVYKRAYRSFLENYKRYSEEYEKIAERLEEIESRRRYIDQG